MNPSKEDLQRYQFQNALSEGDTGEMQKNSSQLLLEGLEMAKKQVQIALLGYHTMKVKDGDTYKQVKVNHHDGRKLCNEKAVGDFMATMEGVVNINTAGSNLNDKNIQDLGENAMLSIVQLIYENHNEYDIYSTAVANQIVSIISSNLMSSLRKARNARFLRHDEETRTVRTIETNTGEEDKGIL